jgi:Cu+-exporting ATPase
MTHTYHINGMACATCASTVEQRLGKLSGVQEVHVNLAKKEAVVTTDREITAEQVKEALNGTNYHLMA